MKKGFTLVELLFVMAIISILAGIGISQMSGSTDAAMKVAMKSDVRSAITAAQIEFSNNQSYVASSYTSTNDAIGIDFIGATPTSFCVQASATLDEGQVLFSYDSTNNDGIVEGACATGGPSISMG